MPVLPLVLLLTLTAGDDRTIPPGCREDHGTCREDCTIDYGGGTTKYQQLNQCVARCNRERDACTTRFYSLRDTAGDQPASPTGPAPAAEQFDKPSKPTSVQDTERRGVYRADEAAPPAEAPPEQTPTAPAPSAPAESEVKPREEPAAAPKPPAEVKKSAPTRGEREEIRIFGDADDAATEASTKDAAPPAETRPSKPAETRPSKPAETRSSKPGETPKKGASKRRSEDDWWKD